MKFEELTPESQQQAREVLGDLLRIKYQACLDLPDNTRDYLGHRVRESFIALETKLPATGSDED